MLNKEIKLKLLRARLKFLQYKKCPKCLAKVKQKIKELTGE